MTINWQPFETMPIGRDVFVFSDDGDIDVGSKTQYGGGFHRRTGDPIPVSYHYSPSLVGGYEWDWDLDKNSIIAWAEIPDDKPSWYVPKPPYVPPTPEEVAQLGAAAYITPLFGSVIGSFSGVPIRVTGDE